MNPNKQHKCVISLKMADGSVYKRIIKFKVAAKQLVELQLGGTVIIDGKSKMDEIALMLLFPDKRGPIPHYLDEEIKSPFPYLSLEQGIVKRLRDPANWTIEYEDGTPAPKINAITGSTSTCYLKLDRELERLDKTVIIKFSPAEGMFTKAAKLKI